MKIQIASDLHFEIWKRFMPDPEGQFEPDEARDLLILAGDITDGNRQFGVSFIGRELGVSPVIYVPGNHEYFHAQRRDTEAFWRGFAGENEGFYYLNDDTVEIGGLRFYGAEWCSDFWGKPPALFHNMIEDFHVTPGWGTTPTLKNTSASLPASPDWPASWTWWSRTSRPPWRPSIRNCMQAVTTTRISSTMPNRWCSTWVRSCGCRATPTPRLTTGWGKPGLWATPGDTPMVTRARGSP